MTTDWRWQTRRWAWHWHWHPRQRVQYLIATYSATWPEKNQVRWHADVVGRQDGNIFKVAIIHYDFSTLTLTAWPQKLLEYCVSFQVTTSATLVNLSGNKDNLQYQLRPLSLKLKFTQTVTRGMGHKPFNLLLAAQRNKARHLLS